VQEDGQESQADVTFPWTVRWPDSDKGPYAVALETKVVDGRYEVVSLAIRSVDESAPTPIRSNLRDLRLRELLDAHLATIKASRVSDTARSWGNPLNAPEFARARRVLADQPKRSGRPRLYDREYFEKVAQVYTHAIPFGRPTRAVADKWEVSLPTAKKWVARCRSDEFKLLPKTTRGRATSATTRPKRGKP
jgi:hypothetical protein